MPDIDYDPHREHGDGTELANEAAWPGDDDVAERLTDFLLNDDEWVHDAIAQRATEMTQARQFPAGFDPYGD